MAKIGRGALVLLGIHRDDDYAIAKKMALKLPKVKLWSNAEHKPWSSGAMDSGFEILVVS